MSSPSSSLPHIIPMIFVVTISFALIATSHATQMETHTQTQTQIQSQTEMTDSIAPCTPFCSWECGVPKCNQTCTVAERPVCERPTCHIYCEPLQCAKCTVHCPKPVCTVRCLNSTCEDDGCPACEAVCPPASALKCFTKCQSPAARCHPVCTPLNCTRPTVCTPCEQHISCNLVCKRRPCVPNKVPTCANKATCNYRRITSPRDLQMPSPPRIPVKSSPCCTCGNVGNTMAAIQLAETGCTSSNCQSAAKPSLLQIMDSFRQQHTSTHCCPCAHAAAASSSSADNNNNDQPNAQEQVMFQDPEELKMFARYGLEQYAIAQAQKRDALLHTPLFSSYAKLAQQQSSTDMSLSMGGSAEGEMTESQTLSFASDDHQYPPEYPYPSPLGATQQQPQQQQ